MRKLTKQEKISTRRKTYFFGKCFSHLEWRTMMFFFSKFPLFSVTLSLTPATPISIFVCLPPFASFIHLFLLCFTMCIIYLILVAPHFYPFAFVFPGFRICSAWCALLSFFWHAQHTAAAISFSISMWIILQNEMFSRAHYFVFSSNKCPRACKYTWNS